MVADNVFRNWLSMTVEDDAVIHNGLGNAVWRSLGVFYANRGIIVLRYLECLQGDLNVLTGMFLRIELMANAAKSKTMACQMGKIRSGMSEEAVGQISTGKGDTFRERLRCCLPLPD